MPNSVKHQRDKPEPYALPLLFSFFPVFKLFPPFPEQAFRGWRFSSIFEMEMERTSVSFLLRSVSSIEFSF